MDAPSIAAVNAFHVTGLLLALWALILAALGITREDFPGRPGARVVMAISALLVAAAIGSAVLTAAAEEEEHPEGSETGLVVPR